MTCSVEPAGAGLVCRIRTDEGEVVTGRSASAAGGRRPAGSRADSAADSPADSPARSPARSMLDALAAHVAHRLARAAQRGVECELCVPAASCRDTSLIGAVHELVHRTARELRERRLARELETSPVRARVAEIAGGVRDDIERFMEIPVNALLGATRRTLIEARARHFQRRVQLFAPLYLSSACQSDCAYCGFRRSARFRRRRLTRDEALDEARALAERGHRTVDLVTGEVPTDRFVDYVCEVVREILVRTPIRRIHLNLGALEPGQFRRLLGAGALGYHLYQETYDRDVYRRVHRAGPKRDMARRLEAPHVAAAAGFEVLGLGALLGLGPLHEDLASLVAHAVVLKQDHPGLQVGFSLPRVREVDAGCEYRPGRGVSDERFVKACVYLELTFPDAHLTVTTRESPRMRDELLRLGASRLSADVSTAPGGYRRLAGGARQFAIRDERSVAEMRAAIESAGAVVAF